FPDFVKLVFFPALLKYPLEFIRNIEMILDRIFAASGDDGDIANAGVDGFFDDILNERLVDKREHFLRLSLGGGKKSRPQSRRGKHCFCDAHLLSSPRSATQPLSRCGTSGSCQRNAWRLEDNRPPIPEAFYPQERMDRFGMTSRRIMVSR